MAFDFKQKLPTPQEIREMYPVPDHVAQIKKDIALQCGVDESDCRIKMDDMKIILIRVRVKNADKMQKEWQNELAFRYGVEEEKIWIEEA